MPDTDQGDEGEGTDQNQDDSLAKLTAALFTLSSADRAKIAAMLIKHQGESDRRTE
jgi:hypothetical protein